MLTHFSVGFFLFRVSLCSPVIRVTNGTAVAQGQAPYFVRIIALASDMSEELCGGTIIDQTTVITAAHCVFPPHDPVLRKANAIQIYFGNVDIKKQISECATEIYVHPGYNMFTLENDIAVVKTKPFQYVAGVVQPIPIYNGNVWPLHEMEIYGWGLTITGGSTKDLPPSLLTNKVYIAFRNDCRVIDQRYIGANGPTICANNNYHKGVDVCSGDSGQGIIIRRLGTAYIAGLVSYGTDANGGLTCGEPGSFGMYTHIWRYMSWVTTLPNTTYTAGPLPAILVAPPSSPTPTVCFLGYCF